jgi:hypothetical protein
LRSDGRAIADDIEWCTMSVMFFFPHCTGLERRDHPEWENRQEPKNGKTVDNRWMDGYGDSERLAIRVNQRKRGEEVSQGGVGYGGAGAIGQPKARQRNRAFARSSPPIASTGY